MVSNIISCHSQSSSYTLLSHIFKFFFQTPRLSAAVSSIPVLPSIWKNSTHPSRPTSKHNPLIDAFSPNKRVNSFFTAATALCTYLVILFICNNVSPIRLPALQENLNLIILIQFCIFNAYYALVQSKYSINVAQINGPNPLPI